MGRRSRKGGALPRHSKVAKIFSTEPVASPEAAPVGPVASPAAAPRHSKVATIFSTEPVASREAVPVGPVASPEAAPRHSKVAKIFSTEPVASPEAALELKVEAIIDAFITKIEKLVNDETAKAPKATFLSGEPEVKVTLAPEPFNLEVVKVLDEALTNMRINKVNRAIKTDRSPEAYAQESGISTEDAHTFLVDLVDDQKGYTINAKPKKLQSFVKKLKNAKSFIDADIEPIQTRKFEDRDRGFAFRSADPNAADDADADDDEEEEEALKDYYRNRSPMARLRRAARGKGGRKTRKLGNKFNRCVKSVRSTVKARKGSNKESAAIAICTTSVLHPRGRTIKRYRKKRLITQKKFRGGGPWCS
jgi:hypothetical protein